MKIVIKRGTLINEIEEELLAHIIPDGVIKTIFLYQGVEINIGMEVRDCDTLFTLARHIHDGLASDSTFKQCFIMVSDDDTPHFVAMIKEEDNTMLELLSKIARA